MPTDPALREGHGKWVAIQKPAAGTLWCTDMGVVGFEPTPGADPAPVDAVLDTAAEAGRTGGEAFDMLTALIGTVVSVGDLGTFRPESGRTPRAQTAGPSAGAETTPAQMMGLIAQTSMLGG